MTYPTPLYQLVAHGLQALRNFKAADEISPFQDIWEERLQDQLPAMLPRGSGFNSGTSLDLEVSTPQKLVFLTAYHHMDAHGSYSHWTKHKVIVKPCLRCGFTIKATGGKRDDRNYLEDTFHYVLTQPAHWEA